MTTVNAKVLYYPKEEMFITLVNKHFFLGEYPEIFRDNVTIEQIIGQVDESERWKAKDYTLLDVCISQSTEGEDARPTEQDELWDELLKILPKISMSAPMHEPQRRNWIVKELMESFTITRKL